MTMQEIAADINSIENICRKAKGALEALAKAYPEGLNPLPKSGLDAIDYIDEYDPVQLADINGYEYYILGIKPYDNEKEVVFLTFDSYDGIIVGVPWYDFYPIDLLYVLKSIKELCLV